MRRYAGYPTDAPVKGDHLLGCIMLAAPVFFEPGMWVDAPRDWLPQTMVSKTYDTTHGEGRRIWHDCLERAAASIRQGPSLLGIAGARRSS